MAVKRKSSNDVPIRRPAPSTRAKTSEAKQVRRLKPPVGTDKEKKKTVKKAPPRAVAQRQNTKQAINSRSSPEGLSVRLNPSRNDSPTTIDYSPTNARFRDKVPVVRIIPLHTATELNAAPQAVQQDLTARSQNAKQTLSSPSGLSVRVNPARNDSTPTIVDSPTNARFNENVSAVRTATELNAAPQVIAQYVSAKQVTAGSVSESQSAMENEEELDCLICLDTSDHTSMRYLHCFHKFHEVCINRWLDDNWTRRCPICRSYVDRVVPDRSSHHRYEFRPAARF